MLAVLFADGFNVQQMLASGVIGGGIACTITAGTLLKQQMEKRKQEAKETGQPVKLGDLYLKAFLMMVVGITVIIGGIAWRANATQSPKNTPVYPVRR
jgi:hypothetical protein